MVASTPAPFGAHQAETPDADSIRVPTCGVTFNALASALAAKARLTVLVAAAVLVGAAGGVHAATAGASHPVTVTTVAETTHADKAQKDKARSTKDEQESQDRAAKPTKSPRPAGVAGQTHGACVSAVARDVTLVGGRNNNHGGAVSAAAHSCAGSQSKKSDRVGKPGKPTKSTKSPKPTKSAPGQEKSSDARGA
jgi:hypothetical protein